MNIEKVSNRPDPEIPPEVLRRMNTVVEISATGPIDLPPPIPQPAAKLTPAERMAKARAAKKKPAEPIKLKNIDYIIKDDIKAIGLGSVREKIEQGFLSPPVKPFRLTRELRDKVNAKTYPDAPPMDHRGDLTPDFVDFLYYHHPEDFEIRYAFRITHRTHLQGQL